MSKTGNKVNVFIPCQMDMFSPMVSSSVFNILEKIGVEPLYNKDQTCCGRCLYMQGETELVKPLANNLLSQMDYTYPTIVPTTACVSFIKSHYKDLLENIAVPSECKTFVQHVYELCYYLVKIQKITCLGNHFEHRVFYFKSCSARNYYKLENEPEILLQNTKGLDLLVDESLNLCCGANGNFATTNPEASDKLLEQIVENIYKKGVQYITSTDIECLQHIEAYLSSHNLGIEVIHIADILNSGL